MTPTRQAEPITEGRPRSSRRSPLSVAIVGIDGCGKSSAYRGAIESLHNAFRVAGVGEQLWSGAPGTRVVEREDVPLARGSQKIGAWAKNLRCQALYKDLKFLELAERTSIEEHIATHDAPDVILTDGHPLVNFAAWAVARYYREQLAGDDGELCRALGYLTGQPVPWTAMRTYLPRAWQVVVVSRLRLVRFRLPDMVVFLDIAPSTAVQRIMARGRPLQSHESEAFLSELREGYQRVCRVLQERYDIRVVRLPADELSPEHTVRLIAAAVKEQMMKQQDTFSAATSPETIEIIATTMSGSMQDQQKIPSILPEFSKHTSRPVRVHAVDTHAEARAVAHEIVTHGGRIVVSAGGGGTFNAVLEGCLIDGRVPAGLRLAFLRKGSADLIGKVLAIPDTLDGAVEAILDGIDQDRCIPMDILAVDTTEPDGTSQHKHMVGFGGFGAFGEVPRISESRMIKYYKGFLGSLFGDLGPFAVALTLAGISWRVQRFLHRLPPTIVSLDGEEIGPDTFPAIVIMNGDLGHDFPLGQRLALGSGSFRVILLRYRGLRQAISQIIACRNAAILSEPDRYNAIVRTVTRVSVHPVRALPYMVNVDSLKLPTAGTVEVTVGDRVQVIAGRDSRYLPGSQAANGQSDDSRLRATATSMS